MSGSRARINYVADFETTTDYDDCRVWAWGLAPINDWHWFEFDNTIESFICRISSKASITWFHNLRFDGHFILDHILKQGYEHTFEKTLKPGQFSTLIGSMGQFYTFTVKWLNGITTEFRDSYKKIVMPVSRIAKAFKLGESKGEIDYKSYREPGHELTKQEIDYLRRDVQIVAQAMAQVLASGMKKITVGADSLSEYKESIGMRQFERWFPTLSKSMDDEIRRAYRGGFTYADDRFKGRQHNTHGLVFDVNSLYPSVMAACLLPWGEPVFVRGKVLPTESHPLTIFSVTFTAKLKPKHIPCIQIKLNRFFNGVEYLKEIKEMTTLVVSNVDWDLYNEHYDIKVIAWNGGWRFMGQHDMFKAYIDKWSTIKANSVGGQKEIAKMHLNTLYGKFATNPEVECKIPTIKDGAVKLVSGPKEIRKPVYTAMGVFITSYARAITIRAAQANYDTFAYADTDSLHLLTAKIPDNLDVHPTKLGAWKLEYHFDTAFYIRPKAYMERSLDYECEHNEDDNEGHGEQCKIVTHIAGLPVKVTSEMNFNDLYDGHVLSGKLNAKAVPGGIVLKDIDFELKM